MINFMNGQPSLDVLPTKLFSDAAVKALSRPNAANDLLQYGPEYGHTEFLNNLAIFLSKEYQSFVSSRHLCGTPGASLSLQHILTILTRPQSTTQYVYFQDPTYFLSFEIFTSVGFRREQFRGIPEQDDASGMDLDRLEDFLRGQPVKRGDIFDSVLYCVPTHANPTGSILSASKRRRLVQLGRKYNMLIICDDVYDILTFQGEIPQRVVAYDLLEDGNEKHVVISNGSFSKILAPGARAGWIEAGETIIKQVAACGSFISGGSPSNLSSQIINEMLGDGSLHHHVEFLRKTHGDRLYEGLLRPMQRDLVPLGCSIPVLPRGGYFVWLKLPIPGNQLMEVTRHHKIEVNVGLGTLFSVTEDTTHYVRLSFANYDTKTLQLGVSRLQQALSIALKTN